jgi:hypothetical protein
MAAQNRQRQQQIPLWEDNKITIAVLHRRHRAVQFPNTASISERHMAFFCLPISLEFMLLEFVLTRPYFRCF